MQKAFNRRIIDLTWSLGIVAGASLVFSVDQAIKHWILKHPDTHRDVVFSLVQFTLEKNAGIAFGILLPRLLMVASTLLLGLLFFGLMIWWMLRRQWLAAAAAALLLAGAVSNGVDRVVYGVVIDYLSVRWFTVLNLADIAITLGAVGLAYRTWKSQPTLDTSE